MCIRDNSPASVRGTGTNKNDNNNNNGDNDAANFDLCRQMKPFLLCLRLTGLLRTCSSRETVTAPRKWTWCDLLLHIHNAVVLVLLWLNLGLALSGFTSVTSFDGSLCNQLVTSAFVPAGGVGSEQSLTSVASAGDVSAAIQVGCDRSL